MAPEYTVPTGPISRHLFNGLVDIDHLAQDMATPANRERLRGLLHEMHVQVDRVAALEKQPLWLETLPSHPRAAHATPVNTANTQEDTPHEPH